jgi:hypothetical protein
VDLVFPSSNLQIPREIKLLSEVGFGIGLGMITVKLIRYSDLLLYIIDYKFWCFEWDFLWDWIFEILDIVIFGC